MAATSLDVDWPTIKTAFVAGATLDELSKALGISLGTLSVRAAREQWTSLRAKPSEKALKERADKTIEKVADIWAQRREEHREDWANITTKQRKRLNRMDEDEVARSLDVVKTMFDIERKNLGLDKPEAGGQMVIMNLMSSMDSTDDDAMEVELTPMDSPDSSDDAPATE